MAHQTNEAMVSIAPYERQLDADRSWALDEGERFFQQDSQVHQALRAIAERLDALAIPYSVAGGMALSAHGYRRFTEDVDILVTRDGLQAVHEQLEGRGYLPPFQGSKNLHDTRHGVKLKFLVTGGFPGDGKPKPVSFPDPADAGTVIDGIRYLSLPALIDLKLASGMTNLARLKDLSDVVELIQLLDLPREFAEQLNPYVRGKFHELWDAVHQAPKRYVLLWKTDLPPGEITSLEALIARSPQPAAILEEMRRDGVLVDPAGTTAADAVLLVTTDRSVAHKYGMHEEEAYWSGGFEQ